MINITKHPDKVMAAVTAVHTEYYFIVDAQTGKPQHFSINSIRTEALGEFMEASSEKLSFLPAGIYDRETALYLIGQSAISAAIDVDNLIKDGESLYGKEKIICHSPSYILVPVSGSCLPIPSPSNKDHE